jgi:uncharacterized damage-inducible protein DinB
MDDPSRLIDDYLGGVSDLRRAFEGLGRDALVARPVPGRWSLLEVLAHLADSEQAWCHRLKRVIAEDRPLLIGYDETRFAARLAYHDRDAGAELGLIDAMRRQMAATLRTLGPDDWARAGVHSERGLVTLGEMVRIEVEHVAHHLRFVREKRRALGLPDVPA